MFFETHEIQGSVISRKQRFYRHLAGTVQNMHKIVESAHRNLKLVFYCIWQLPCQYQLQCTVWTSDSLYTASISELCGYECI